LVEKSPNLVTLDCFIRYATDVLKTVTHVFQNGPEVAIEAVVLLQKSVLMKSTNLRQKFRESNSKSYLTLA